MRSQIRSLVVALVLLSNGCHEPAETLVDGGESDGALVAWDAAQACQRDEDCGPGSVCVATRVSGEFFELSCVAVDAGAPLDGGSEVVPDAALPLTPVLATDVSIGFVHACAVLPDGSVRCWGKNDYGALGDGSTQSTTYAVPVMGLGGAAVRVAAGSFESCALLTTGTVRCWGASQTIGTALPPYDVPLGATAKAISAGAGHFCAILVDGTAQCWGANGYGQIGNGMTGTSPVPPTIVSLPEAVATISAGVYSTCASLVSGAVYCWGGDYDATIGDGTSHALPGPVALPLAATAVSNQNNTVCALLSDKTLRCWGWNMSGGVGDGTMTRREFPVVATALGDKRADLVSAGTCVRLDSGNEVRCWGTALSGGQDLTFAEPVTALAAGGGSACVVLASGALRCWGYNGSGILGDGTTVDSATPTTVVGVP